MPGPLEQHLASHSGARNVSWRVEWFGESDQLAFGGLRGKEHPEASLVTGVISSALSLADLGSSECTDSAEFRFPSAVYL